MKLRIKPGRLARQTATTLLLAVASLSRARASQTENWPLFVRITSGCPFGRSTLTTSYVSGATSKLASSWYVHVWYILA